MTSDTSSIKSRLSTSGSDDGRLTIVEPAVRLNVRDLSFDYKEISRSLTSSPSLSHNDIPNNNSTEQYNHNYSTESNTIHYAESYEKNAKYYAEIHEALQKKTFTRWMNSHINKGNQNVEDIYKDLATGVALAVLLNVLTGETIKLPERGRMRVHNATNLNHILTYIKSKKIKLVGIGAEDIIDGKGTLILGLIWTLIQYFHISRMAGDTSASASANFKKDILEWVKNATKGYSGVGVDVVNLTSSWTDGLAFAALIHRHRPDLIDINELDKSNPIHNMKYSFKVAEDKLNVIQLLEPEDLAKGIADEKCTMTYLSMLKQSLPELSDELSWNEKDQLKHRYHELDKWITQKTIQLKERKMPKNVKECKKLLSSIEQTNKEIPIKQNDFESLKKFEEKIKMMAGEEYESSEEVNMETLEMKYMELAQLYPQYLTELSQHYQKLEAIEDRANNVSKNLDEIEKTLKFQESEIKSLTEEFAKSPNSDVLKKLDEMKEKIRVALQTSGEKLKEADAELIIDQEMECETLTDTKHKLVNLQQYLITLEKELNNLQPDLPDIDSMINWVHNKQDELQNATFERDVADIRQQINEHAQITTEIEYFSFQIDECQQVSQLTNGQNGVQFKEKLQILQEIYNDLKVLATQRCEDLQSLETILSSIQTVHNSLEILEVTERIRSWSPLPNINSLKSALFSLEKSLTEQETNLNKLHTAADNNSSHPGTAIINDQVATVTRRYQWVTNMKIALSQHLTDFSTYQLFNSSLEKLEAQVKSIEKTVDKHQEELEAASISCQTILQPILEKCNGELAQLFEEVNTLADSAPPYHLRCEETVEAQLEGYTMVQCLEKNTIERNDSLTIISKEMAEYWECKLSNGDIIMLPSAIIQLSPKNNISSAERLRVVRETYVKIRDNLNDKLSMIDRLGKLIQEVDQTADTILTWDILDLMGENKQCNIDTFRAFSERAENLFTKLPKNSSVTINLSNKFQKAKEHWITITSEATSEELKERLENLEAWCRHWHQQLNEQVPLGINMEKAQIQSNWYKNLETMIAEKSEEITAAIQEAASNSELQTISQSVNQNFSILKEASDKWGNALSILISGFEELAEAWDWIMALESELLQISDKAMTADTQGSENLKNLREKLLEFINTSVPHYEPKLKVVLDSLQKKEKQLEDIEGTHPLERGGEALGHRWDLLLTEAARLDQGLGDLTKLVALLPAQSEEFGKWIEEQNSIICSREKCVLEIKTFKSQFKSDDKFHKAILEKIPEVEEYTRQAGKHDKIISTTIQSHQNYVLTLSQARPCLTYNTEADLTVTHTFQEDADNLMKKWDDLYNLSDKSIMYKKGILNELDKVTNKYLSLLKVLEEGERILQHKPNAHELEKWLASAKVYFEKKVSQESGVSTLLEEGSSLISSVDECLVDSEPLEVLISEFKSRWDILSFELNEKSTDVEEQIFKFNDEKVQLEQLSALITNKIQKLREINATIIGLSLPAASQYTIDKQLAILNESEISLKSEELNLKDILHKVGETCTNVNTELDQSEIQTLGTQLSEESTEMLQLFYTNKQSIESQNTTVKPFEPQLTSLTELLSNLKEVFKTTEDPCLDAELILKATVVNKKLKDQILSKTDNFESLLITGNEIATIATEECISHLNSSEHDIDHEIVQSHIQLRDKLAKLKVNWDTFSKCLDEREISLREKAQKVHEGSKEAQNILKSVQTLLIELAKKGPPGAVPSVVVEQISDLKHIQTSVEDIKQKIEILKEKLQIASDSPGGLAQQIRDLETAHNNLKKTTSEQLESLNNGLTIAKEYQAKHENLVQWIPKQINALEEMKILNLSTEFIQQHIKAIEEYETMLQNLVPDKNEQESVSNRFCTEERPSHQTTTGEYQEFETLWNAMIEKIKKRIENSQQMLSLMKAFNEQVGSAHNILEECSSEVSLIPNTVPADIAAIQEELDQAEGLLKRINETEFNILELATTLDTIRTVTTASTEYASEMTLINSECDQLKEKKNELTVAMERRIEQLQKNLEIAEKIKFEEKVLLKWIASAEKSISSDFKVRAMPKLCADELEKIDKFHQRSEEIFNKLGQIEQLVNELGENSGENKRSKSLSNIRRRLSSIRSKEENTQASLEDALNRAKEFDDLVKSMMTFLTEIDTKFTQIQEEYTPDNVVKMEQSINEVRELLAKMIEKQLDLERIEEIGLELAKLSPADEDILLDLVAQCQSKFNRLQAQAEKKQRDYELALLKQGEMKKTSENLIKWLTEAKNQLENPPPLAAEIEIVEEAIVKHRTLATQLSTQNDTIDSVIESLPSMGMSEQAKELGELAKEVRIMMSNQGSKLSKALKCLKTFEESSNELQRNIEIHLDYLAEYAECYGMVPTVEEILVIFEGKQKDFPKMEKQLEDLKQLAMSLRSDNLIENPYNVEEQLQLVLDNWKELKEQSAKQSVTIQDALKQAQRIATLHSNLLNWIEPARDDIMMKCELTIAKLESTTKRISELEAGLEKHVPLYEEALSVYDTIRPNTNQYGLDELDATIESLKKEWTSVEQGILGMRLELDAATKGLDEMRSKLENLAQWAEAAYNLIEERTEIPVPSTSNDLAEVEKLLIEHEEFMEELNKRHNEMQPLNHAVKALAKTEKGKEMEEIRKRVSKQMQIIWVRASERQRMLRETKTRIIDIQIAEGFSFDKWIEDFRQHLSTSKMRDGDIFRKCDIINQTYITKDHFIAALKNTGFSCRKQEFELVAVQLEDRNGNCVDYTKFMQALRPRDIENDPRPADVIIHEHVIKEVNKCVCDKKFRVERKVAAQGNMYQFGNNNLWRLVRILRNSIMVRVGGGWEDLDSFLKKHDPCRAAGRTSHDIFPELTKGERPDSSKIHKIHIDTLTATKQNPDNIQQHHHHHNHPPGQTCGGQVVQQVLNLVEMNDNKTPVKTKATKILTGDNSDTKGPKKNSSPNIARKQSFDKSPLKSSPLQSRRSETPKSTLTKQTTLQSSTRATSSTPTNTHSSMKIPSKSNLELKKLGAEGNSSIKSPARSPVPKLSPSNSINSMKRAEDNSTTKSPARSPALSISPSNGTKGAEDNSTPIPSSPRSPLSPTNNMIGAEGSRIPIAGAKTPSQKKSPKDPQN